jgi:RHS repeat-associated protein
LNFGNGGTWRDVTSKSYPDWIEVDFNGSKTIDEIDVVTLQDDSANPIEPSENTTFTLDGIVDFQVQYWNGSSWATVSGGNITGNHKVWKKVNFSALTTSKIRVNITNALGGYSQVTELEAWGSSTLTNNYSYSYDAAGNVTNDASHSYTYDAENRIVSADGGATGQYSYDQSNQHYKKVTSGNTTHYIWQGSQVIAEHNGGTGAGLIDYVHAGSKMIAKVEVGTTQYFLSDRLSTRLVLDTSGNVLGRQGHLPFGDDFGESGTQEKHHFTSYERDGETSVNYALNRYYASQVGRFTTSDPILSLLTIHGAGCGSYQRESPSFSTEEKLLHIRCK